MRTLHGKTWYRPREIAQLGLIKNRAGGGTESGNYNFILNLIASKRLKAKNYGMGAKPYWLVSEDEIKRYHETLS